MVGDESRYLRWMLMLTTGEKYYLYNSSFMLYWRDEHFKLPTSYRPKPIYSPLKSTRDYLGISSVEMQLLWASSSMSRAAEVRYRFWCFTGNGLVKTRLLRYWTIMSHPISVNQWKGRPTFPPLRLMMSSSHSAVQTNFRLRGLEKKCGGTMNYCGGNELSCSALNTLLIIIECVFGRGRGG